MNGDALIDRRLGAGSKVVALVVFVLSGAGHRAALANQTDPAHPCLFVTADQRDAIEDKVANVDWARSAYGKLKAEVDRYVAYCQSDPQWMTSRLLMNWQTHFELPIVQRERWIGGEGEAPVPTPRFAGARDWATQYHSPQRIEDFRPFNDNAGKIWLIDANTNTSGWVDPGQTGRTIEIANARILQIAANASFVYWLTGQEKYAKFAADILWTYMRGFSYVELPRDETGRGPNRIIGMTSFEVIHEDSMLPLGEAYDFLHEYLAAHGYDVTLIQNQLKRLADRVIAGGGATGNWNLNQAKEIAPATLALDDDSAFPDHHGREYYVDVLLNARLPAQTGIVHVIHEGYDSETALWPEAPGYGFGTTPQLIQIASMLSNDPAGRAVLGNPFLSRAILAQSQLLYPNGWSIGLGDTDNTRINSTALELMIAVARKAGDGPMEDQLTAVLWAEINAGFHDRSAEASIPAITQYVAELKPVSAEAIARPRTFFGSPLNVLIQRNGTDPDHALSAAMYGTEGGHVHANGMAIELYGAGLVMGADPGRGASYWTRDHAEYYSQPPAHNTVIVNEDSNYPAYGAGRQAMSLEFVEPSSGQEGVDENISVAEGSFKYPDEGITQQRTVALVRLNRRNGIYFDVFRSKMEPMTGHYYQDYLYHNIGQSLLVEDDKGNPLPLAASHRLAPAQGQLPGYGYFRDEESTEFSGDLHAVFTVDVPKMERRLMNVWMPGKAERTIFSVSAPADHAAREELPKEIQTLAMPTLLVRRVNRAWENPFVAVFEPAISGEGIVRSVRSVVPIDDRSGIVACEAAGDGFAVTLLQDAEPQSTHDIAGIRFAGSFGAIVRRGGVISEIYLGNGTSLSADGVSILAGAAVSASIVPSAGGWRYSASGPVYLKIVSAPTHRIYVDGDFPAGKDRAVSKGS